MLRWVDLENKKVGDYTEYEGVMRMLDMAQDLVSKDKEERVNLNPSLLQNIAGISVSRNLNLLSKYAKLQKEIEKSRREYLIRNVLNCKSHRISVWTMD